MLFCIPKILKNESNSQPNIKITYNSRSCFVSQRYWKMKAIHNAAVLYFTEIAVVLYPKDTEKWKQFTTLFPVWLYFRWLFCIPKILKNESNSQPLDKNIVRFLRCFVSQRYWKMKAIHNSSLMKPFYKVVVLYPKDTEKWKQFTTNAQMRGKYLKLFCIPKILKNESNSQPFFVIMHSKISCFVSQRYWKMKAIHNSTVCLV